MSPTPYYKHISTAHRVFFLCSVMLCMHCLTITNSVLAGEGSPPLQTVLPSAEQTQMVAPPENDGITLSDEMAMEKLGKEIKELKQQLLILSQENTSLKEDQRTNWFLAGGVTLVIGWLLGLISCHTKKRKPSLL